MLVFGKRTRVVNEERGDEEETYRKPLAAPQAMTMRPSQTWMGAIFVVCLVCL